MMLVRLTKLDDGKTHNEDIQNIIINLRSKLEKLCTKKYLCNIVYKATKYSIFVQSIYLMVRKLTIFLQLLVTQQ